MEQAHPTCPEETPILPACDREVFERVWRRVMPEARPDCPFPLAEAPPSAPAAEAPATALAVRTPEAVLPAAPAPEPPDPENDVPCLGASSAVYGALLQAFIDREIAGWKRYALLARRAPGNGGRVLATMAADERRHAKRLSTAYFLISGVRYWPADRANQPLTGTYPAALRSCFCAEQKAEAAYRAAANETADEALRELYQELAGDENAHTWLLRGLAEQL